MKYRTKRLCVLITILTILVSVLSGCNSDLEDGIIMEGVYVAGVDIGGMSKDDAINAVRLATEEAYTSTPMVITILGDTITLTPEITGVAIDAEAAVDAAYALGRTGSKVEKEAQKLQAMTTGLHTDISDCLNLDKSDLQQILQKLCENYTNTALTQPGYEVAGEAPDLAAEEMPENLQTLTITLGTPEFKLDLDSLINQVLDAYQKGEFETEYLCDMVEPDPIDLDAIAQELCHEPVDAVMDNETFAVSEHSYGYGFDLEQAKELLEQAGYGDQIEIPFAITAPAHTKKALEDMLFRDVLAEASAYSASSNNRATNLRLACEALDGIVLLPGEQLSYSNTLGERSAENGWKPAASYVGGETVDTYGGGICQPSSVLYYCTLLADLEIIDRSCHQYISSYVDPGMDATIAWGFVDFVFANNTEYPLRIDAKADGGNVEIRLVGTDTKDYYIDMEYEILRYKSWDDEVVEVDEDNNPKGYKDGEVITTPYTGYSVVTYKCRYSKADDSLIERVMEAKSEYDSRNRRTVKIISDEPEETEPEETKPEETKPYEPPVTEPPTTEPPETEPPETAPPETEPPVTDPPEPDPPVEPSEPEDQGNPGQGVGEG